MNNVSDNITEGLDREYMRFKIRVKGKLVDGEEKWFKTSQVIYNETIKQPVRTIDWSKLVGLCFAESSYLN